MLVAVQWLKIGDATSSCVSWEKKKMDMEEDQCCHCGTRLRCWRWIDPVAAGALSRRFIGCLA